MVVHQEYQVVDRRKGTLERSIFIDSQTYQEELERIFGRAWLMIGHESLVPSPNDFFLTYMGEDPVILCRTASGQLKAFLNMCRHRGNRIVRADDGNAKNFMCAYHGWTYSNEGKLVSVPGLQEAYYGELDVDSLGLVEVAHLDTYAGFVFSTWAEDAPSLEAYLGNERYYMDVLFNRRDGGIELIGPDKWIIPNNWKNSADNFIGDMYHAPLSHRSAALVRAKFRGVNPQGINRGYAGQPGSHQVSPGNGHGNSCRLVPEELSDEQRWEQQALGQIAIISDYQRSIEPEMIRRLGDLRGRRVRPGHTTVFPNFSYLNGNHTTRIWHPRGPAHTEVWSFMAIDKAAPQEVKDAYRVNCMQSFGPSGLLEQDDMDNWRSSSEAGKSPRARGYLQEISMGIAHEYENPHLPGRSIPAFCGEINQRSMYARWQEFMNARSWADISVDPITAIFEGTATMKG